jgi:50S ribosomal protein L16 3-hydroxylase
MHSNTKTPLLAGLTPREFLSRHWQKQPLLVRQAIPGFQGPLTRAAVMRLAQSAEQESRLVQRRGRKWLLEHGPLPRGILARLPARNWTLLVQGLNHALPAADELLRRFDFIPAARLDDVMVSYAAPGGGVGPHIDSYDVFLLQGAGRRRWRVAGRGRSEFRRDVQLKILQHFEAQQEWVLEPGDMLYLPPGYAHEGVALDACFTYSIGFRAPSHQELRRRFLDYLQDRLADADDTGRLADPGLGPTSAPGALPKHMLAQAGRALASLRWDRDIVADFLARDLTEPKSHPVFAAPQRPLDQQAFDRAMERHGLALDAKSLMLYDGARVYLNGERATARPGAKTDVATLCELADRRRLKPGVRASATLLALLRSWYLYGFVHIDGEIHP